MANSDPDRELRIRQLMEKHASAPREKRGGNRPPKPVIVYRSEWIQVGLFRSQREAAEALGISPSIVSALASRRSNRRVRYRVDYV